MNDVEITIRLPETLGKEAEALGVLSSEHIEMLLRADIQREICQIDADLWDTEGDGLDTL